MKMSFSGTKFAFIVLAAAFAAASLQADAVSAQEGGSIIDRSDGAGFRQAPDPLLRGGDSSVTTIRRSSDFGAVGTQTTPRQRSLRSRRDFGPGNYGPRQFGNRYGVQRFHRHSHTGTRSAVGRRN